MSLDFFFGRGPMVGLAGFEQCLFHISKAKANEEMNSEVPRTARSCCSALLTSSGWSSGLPLPHILPAISPPAVSVSKTNVWSQALPDEKPSQGTGTAAPSGNLPGAGEKTRICMGIRMRIPREMHTGQSLVDDSSGALTETFHAVSAGTTCPFDLPVMVYIDCQLTS